MAQFKPRIEDRTKVMIRARLRGAGPERDACIVDLSSRGLAAAAEDPPGRGDFVEMVVGDAVLVGQVKWSSTRRFGMAFRERISVIGVLSGEGGAVGLKARQAQDRKRERRQASAAGGGIGRRLQFLVLLGAGAAATFYIAENAGAALHSLDAARIAMAGAEAP